MNRAARRAHLQDDDPELVARRAAMARNRRALNRLHLQIGRAQRRGVWRSAARLRQRLADFGGL